MPATATRPQARARRVAIAAGILALGTLTIALPLVATLLQTGTGGCTAPGAAPSALAKRQVPPGYLAAYRAAGARYGVPWAVLAAIGEVETDWGQSNLRGVHSGQNLRRRVSD